eukprot:285800-Rhodomonas_salina.1
MPAVCQLRHQHLLAMSLSAQQTTDPLTSVTAPPDPTTRRIQRRETTLSLGFEPDMRWLWFLISVSLAPTWPCRTTTGPSVIELRNSANRFRLRGLRSTCQRSARQSEQVIAKLERER